MFSGVSATAVSGNDRHNSFLFFPPSMWNLQLVIYSTVWSVDSKITQVFIYKFEIVWLCGRRHLHHPHWGRHCLHTVKGDWESEQADVGGERWGTWVTWTGSWQKQGGGFLEQTMERHFWSNKLQSSSLFPTLSQVITPINFIKVAGGFTNIWEVP